MQKFLQNKKISNLGPKMRGNFKVEFEKTNFIFEINTLDFVNKQILCKKKNLKFGPKLLYFGTNRLQF